MRYLLILGVVVGLLSGCGKVETNPTYFTPKEIKPDADEVGYSASEIIQEKYWKFYSYLETNISLIEIKQRENNTVEFSIYDNQRGLVWQGQMELKEAQ